MSQEDLPEKRKHSESLVSSVDSKRAMSADETSAEEQFKEEMDILKEKVGVVIGHRGVVIQDIMRRSNCKIVIDQNFPEGHPHKVRINSSKKENITIAKDLLAKVIEGGPSALEDAPGAAETATMTCPQDKVGIVIGARGVVVNEIMRRSRCKVVINQEVPAGEPAVVMITGLPAQIAEAKDLVNKVVENGPAALTNRPPPSEGPITTETMDMPREKVGIVIGTRGVIVQEIMGRSGCKVVLNQDVPDGTPCKAVITGYPEQIAMAKTLILSVVANGPSGVHMCPGIPPIGLSSPAFVEEVAIDQVHVGKLLGPGGAVIKDMQQRFGVKMKVDSASAGSNGGAEGKVVRISGEMQRVRAAMHAVMEIIHAHDGYMPRGVHNGNPVTGHQQPPQGAYFGRNANMPPSQPQVYSQEPILGSLPQGTLGLGSDGTAGHLYPASAMPNGLQNQVAVIRQDQALKVLGQGMSTLSLIQKKSGADLHTRPDYSPEMPCEITIVGLPKDVRLAGQMIQEALTGGLARIQEMPDKVPNAPGYPSTSGYTQPPIGYGQPPYAHAYGATGYPSEGGPAWGPRVGNPVAYGAPMSGYNPRGPYSK
jgi:rRNA processing protein Krr1/Pno1